MLFPPNILMARNNESGPTVPTPNFAFGLKAVNGFSGDIVRLRNTWGGDSEDDYTASEYDSHSPSGDSKIVHLDNQGSESMTNLLEQTTNTQQPDGVTSGTKHVDSNGNPVLKLDGINDFLETSDSNLLALNTGVSPEHSIILVCEFDTIPSANEVLYEFRKITDVDDLCRFQYNATDSELHILYRDPNRTKRYDELCGAISTNTQYIIEIYVGSVLNVFVNGTQVVTNVAQVTTIANSPDAFGYGSAANGSNNWFDGALKELQIFDSNKLTDRATIYNDINNRWS